jgi:hypothetical protein
MTFSVVATDAGAHPPASHVRLTIAIPTLNRARDLRRAIDSALAQSSREIEVLVSDNGSTDDTRAVVESYDDSRLRTFRRVTTIPAADHGNFLIHEARGELFLGLSDDDYLEPTFAERVIALYDQHPEVAFVYTRCLTHVGHRESTVLTSPNAPELEDPLSFLRGYFSGQRQLSWCACVTRTADLRRIGGLPPGTLIGDLHLWTQIVFSGPVGCVDELLSHYTYLAGNSSIRIPVCDWSRETRAVFGRISARLAELRAAPAEREGIERAMRRYLARSTANQIALNASRGASKAALLQALWRCGADLRGNLGAALPRVLVALLLPARLASSLANTFIARRRRN